LHGYVLPVRNNRRHIACIRFLLQRFSPSFLLVDVYGHKYHQPEKMKLGQSFISTHHNCIFSKKRLLHAAVM